MKNLWDSGSSHTVSTSDERQAGSSEDNRSRNGPGSSGIAGRAPLTPSATASAREARPLGRASRDRFRQLLGKHIPGDASLIVVSKGDESLLRVGGRSTAHFPSLPDGTYAGYHPGDSLSAIAQLEVARARGADFLVVPATSAWWLEHYESFTRHLARHYLVLNDPAATIVDLRRPNSDPTVSGGTFDQLIDRFETMTGRTPCVLDWRSQLSPHEVRQDIHVFHTATESRSLPYLDSSVDMVVVGQTPTDLPEARRAGLVAAQRDSSVTGAGGWRADWSKIDAQSSLPTCSLVIPCYNGEAMTRACLTAVFETLPPGFRGEIVVVDDASTDGTAQMLAQVAEHQPHLRVLRNPRNLGFIDSSNRGAAESVGDHLVFLNNDTVPLSGWLPPLLRLLDSSDEIGAVGGRLLSADGTLQEAGGLIFKGGNGANFGRGQLDPGAELFSYVREVDYCSGALLATKRSLFREIGGFDTRYRPAYYEDTDYCFTVRAQGRRVLYQPDSVVVHLEGGTSGTDPATGVKSYQVRNRKIFADKWATVLASYPDGPGRFDREAWMRLATWRPTR